MKYLFIVFSISALFCCSSSAFAQKSPWSFGLKAGVNRATVSGEDAKLSLAKFASIPTGFFDLTAEPQPKTAFAGGVYIAYAFSDLFSVQAEVLLSGKGVGYNRDFSVSLLGNNLSGNVTADAEVSYIEIPLLAKLVLPVAGTVQPYLYGGPSLGVLTDKATSVRIKASGLSNVGIPDNLPIDIPATFAFYDIDWSAVVGGGVRFRLENTALGLDARYTMGLRSALESIKVSSPTGPDGAAQKVEMKHRVLTVVGCMEFYF